MKKIIAFIILILVGCSEAPQEVSQFVKSTAPELLTKIDNLSNTIDDVDTKIQKLTELQNRFPAQNKITQPRIKKWHKVRTQLIQTQTDIQFQIERAFVIYKTDQEIEGTQKFTRTLQALIQQADEALSTAKSMATVVENNRDY